LLGQHCTARRGRRLSEHLVGDLSWAALSGAVLLCADLYAKWQAEEHVELLWAGPPPANGVPARRIDQALYDLISSAEREILLITFAAHRIRRLAEILAAALCRGVRICLLLEFEAQSQHQLSADALKAFPADLQEAAEIFYRPLEKRELNTWGRPANCTPRRPSSTIRRFYQALTSPTTPFYATWNWASCSRAASFRGLCPSTLSTYLQTELLSVGSIELRTGTTG